MNTEHLETDAIVPPGEELAEELAARGMTPKEFAEKMGVSERLVSGLLVGEKPLTAEFALSMERVLGVNPQLWLNLEAQYRLALARQNERKSA